MQWCRGERSAIEQIEHRFRITRPGKSIFRRDFLDASQIVIAKIDIECTDVFLQKFAASVPGIGTIFSPWASTQASVSCVGVHFFSRAIWPTPSKRSGLR